jgi:hypothetical protein
MNLNSSGAVHAATTQSNGTKMQTHSNGVVPKNFGTGRWGFTSFGGA